MIERPFDDPDSTAGAGGVVGRTFIKAIEGAVPLKENPKVTWDEDSYFFAVSYLGETVQLEMYVSMENAAQAAEQICIAYGWPPVDTREP